MSDGNGASDGQKCFQIGMQDFKHQYEPKFSKIYEYEKRIPDDAVVYATHVYRVIDGICDPTGEIIDHIEESQGSDDYVLSESEYEYEYEYYYTDDEGGNAEAFAGQDISSSITPSTYSERKSMRRKVRKSLNSVEQFNGNDNNINTKETKENTEKKMDNIAVKLESQFSNNEKKYNIKKIFNKETQRTIDIMNKRKNLKRTIIPVTDISLQAARAHSLKLLGETIHLTKAGRYILGYPMYKPIQRLPPLCDNPTNPWFYVNDCRPPAAYRPTAVLNLPVPRMLIRCGNLSPMTLFQSGVSVIQNARKAAQAYMNREEHMKIAVQWYAQMLYKQICTCKKLLYIIKATNVAIEVGTYKPLVKEGDIFVPNNNKKYKQELPVESCEYKTIFSPTNLNEAIKQTLTTKFGRKINPLTYKDESDVPLQPSGFSSTAYSKVTTTMNIIDFDEANDIESLFPQLFHGTFDSYYLNILGGASESEIEQSKKLWNLIRRFNYHTNTAVIIRTPVTDTTLAEKCDEDTTAIIVKNPGRHYSVWETLNMITDMIEIGNILDKRLNKKFYEAKKRRIAQKRKVNESEIRDNDSSMGPSDISDSDNENNSNISDSIIDNEKKRIPLKLYLENEIKALINEKEKEEQIRKELSQSNEPSLSLFTDTAGQPSGASLFPRTKLETISIERTQSFSSFDKANKDLDPVERANMKFNLDEDASNSIANDINSIMLIGRRPQVKFQSNREKFAEESVGLGADGKCSVCKKDYDNYTEHILTREHIENYMKDLGCSMFNGTWFSLGNELIHSRSARVNEVCITAEQPVNSIDNINENENENTSDNADNESDEGTDDKKQLLISKVINRVKKPKYIVKGINKKMLGTKYTICPTGNTKKNTQSAITPENETSDMRHLMVEKGHSLDSASCLKNIRVLKNELLQMNNIKQGENYKTPVHPGESCLDYLICSQDHMGRRHHLAAQLTMLAAEISGELHIPYSMAADCLTKVCYNHGLNFYVDPNDKPTRSKSPTTQKETTKQWIFQRHSERLEVLEKSLSSRSKSKTNLSNLENSKQSGNSEIEAIMLEAGDYLADAITESVYQNKIKERNQENAYVSFITLSSRLPVTKFEINSEKINMNTNKYGNCPLTATEIEKITHLASNYAMFSLRDIEKQFKTMPEYEIISVIKMIHLIDPELYKEMTKLITYLENEKFDFSVINDISNTNLNENEPSDKIQNNNKLIYEARIEKILQFLQIVLNKVGAIEFIFLNEKKQIGNDQQLMKKSSPYNSTQITPNESMNDLISNENKIIENKRSIYSTYIADPTALSPRDFTIAQVKDQLIGNILRENGVDPYEHPDQFLSDGDEFDEVRADILRKYSYALCDIKRDYRAHHNERMPRSNALISKCNNNQIENNNNIQTSSTGIIKITPRSILKAIKHRDVCDLTLSIPCEEFDDMRRFLFGFEVGEINESEADLPKRISAFTIIALFSVILSHTLSKKSINKEKINNFFAEEIFAAFEKEKQLSTKLSNQIVDPIQTNPLNAPTASARYVLTNYKDAQIDVMSTQMGYEQNPDTKEIKIPKIDIATCEQDIICAQQARRKKNSKRSTSMAQDEDSEMGLGVPLNDDGVRITLGRAKMPLPLKVIEEAETDEKNEDNTENVNISSIDIMKEETMKKITQTINNINAFKQYAQSNELLVKIAKICMNSGTKACLSTDKDFTVEMAAKFNLEEIYNTIDKSNELQGLASDDFFIDYNYKPSDIDAYFAGIIEDGPVFANSICCLESSNDESDENQMKQDETIFDNFSDYIDSKPKKMLQQNFNSSYITNKQYKVLEATEVSDVTNIAGLSSIYNNSIKEKFDNGRQTITSLLTAASGGTDLIKSYCISTKATDTMMISTSDQFGINPGIAAGLFVEAYNEAEKVKDKLINEKTIRYIPSARSVLRSSVM